MVEPPYEFTSTFSGEFAAGEIPLRIVTGNGKGFCAGGDVAGMQKRMAAPAGEVAFSERTSDNRLRHPSWRGLRPDKAAEDVVPED